MTDSYLQALVTNKCKALGVPESAKFFGVSEGLIRQWTAGSKSPSLAAVELVFQKEETPQSVTTYSAQWELKDTLLAVPCYKTTDPRTVLSLLGIWDKTKFGAFVHYGDAYVIHTRNIISHQFLKQGLPYCLLIDDDMIVPFGNASLYNYHTGFNFPEEFAGLHTPTQLKSHGKSIVGGVYFGRGPRARAVYYEAMLDSVAGQNENALVRTAPAHRLRPVWWTGTGCLLHTRQVLLDIQAKFPHLAPQQANEPWHFWANSDDKLHFGFIQLKELVDAATAALKEQKGAEAERIITDAGAMITNLTAANKIHSALQQGEDQTFGKRAAVAGHQSYVDHAIVCGHIGTCVYGPMNTGKSA